MTPLPISEPDKVVHTAWKRAVCFFALVLAGFLTAGCVHHDQQELSEADYPTGYYEIRREGTVYVLGSMQSVDKVEAGKPPTNVIPSHSRRGEPLVFEDNGRGLASRLMAEYDRRHGAQ